MPLNIVHKEVGEILENDQGKQKSYLGGTTENQQFQFVWELSGRLFYFLFICLCVLFSINSVMQCSFFTEWMLVLILYCTSTILRD